MVLNCRFFQVVFAPLHEGLLPPVANSAPSWRSKQLETFYLIFSQYPILSSCQLFSDEKVFIGILTCDLILQCREPQRQGRGWFVFQRAHSINNYVGHSDGPFDTLASVFPKKVSRLQYANEIFAQSVRHL